MRGKQPIESAGFLSCFGEKEMKPDERLIVKMKFGSHLYGTETPQSDEDWKAVFIPSRRDILLQRAPHVYNTSTRAPELVKNSVGDVDTETFSLHQFFKLLLEGQTVALDMLFAPERFWMNRSDVWRDILSLSHRFLSRKCTAFVGYCQQQAAKYGIKGSRVAAVREAIATLEELDRTPDVRLEAYAAGWEELSERCEHVNIVQIPSRKDGPLLPHLEVCNRKFAYTLKVSYVLGVLRGIFAEYGKRALAAEKNEGVDWKALSHAVRVTMEAEQLLLLHSISFPLTGADRLRRIKLGEFPYAKVAEWIEEGLERVKKAEAQSSLPDDSDRELAEEITVALYDQTVRGTKLEVPGIMLGCGCST